MLEINQLQKSYAIGDSSLHVLKGIDLSVLKGEMVAIMGSSGSGKSTLLNIIGMLDEADSGDYVLDSVPIKNLTEKLLLWTGDRWIISLSKNGDAKSIYEKNLENKSNKIEEFKKNKTAQDIQRAFPDAKLIDLTEEE